MSATDETDSHKLEDFLAELEKRPRGRFQPCAFYNGEGDMLETFWSDEEHVSHWLNNTVEILVGRPSGAIVGARISGISSLIFDGLCPDDRRCPSPATILERFVAADRVCKLLETRSGDDTKMINEALSAWRDLYREEDQEQGSEARDPRPGPEGDTL